jgi:hypothetical protein
MTDYAEQLRNARKALTGAIIEAPTHEALKVLGNLRGVVDDLLRDVGVSP